MEPTGHLQLCNSCRRGEKANGVNRGENPFERNNMGQTAHSHLCTHVYVYTHIYIHTVKMHRKSARGVQTCHQGLTLIEHKAGGLRSVEALLTSPKWEPNSQMGVPMFRFPVKPTRGCPPKIGTPKSCTAHGLSPLCASGPQSCRMVCWCCTSQLHVTRCYPSTPTTAWIRGIWETIRLFWGVLSFEREPEHTKYLEEPLKVTDKARTCFMDSPRVK